MNCAVDVSLLESCEPDASITAAELTLLSQWLDDFEADNGKRLAVDQGYRLWRDYEGFDLQNRAALALLKKLDTCLAVPVTAPTGSTPQLGAAWAHLDAHRSWLLAVALAPGARASIVNATHVDWEPTRLPNTQPLPTIVQLLRAWLAAFVQGLTPAVVQGQYVPPPKSLTGKLAGAVLKGCGTNGRKAWEDAKYRYEWDYQHGRVEVYALGTGKWVHEAMPDGTITKTTGGQGRTWGR